MLNYGCEFLNGNHVSICGFNFLGVCVWKQGGQMLKVLFMFLIIIILAVAAGLFAGWVEVKMYGKEIQRRREDR